MKLPKRIAGLARTFAEHARLCADLDCIHGHCKEIGQLSGPQGWTCLPHDPSVVRRRTGVVAAPPEFKGDRPRPGDLDLRLLTQPTRGPIQ